ncbi:sodium/potassium/calcium exchanger 4 isoform X2 [Nematostella vectensis]|uniref:sodium/potassium/calcium exchanger 4 isoform X2 n=1 Tax=Nematostella vectensis TaxID=45351 RepID=UPI0020776AC9|nr:sodium/potassium/calcium exchanger 4 isoform X2 [Nematostella vectensis]
MGYLGSRKFARFPRRNTLRWSVRIAAIILFLGCGLVFKSVADNALIIPEGSSTYHSRHLLSMEWEKCDFEIQHKRNYSARETWTAPSSAYVWLVLYIFAILVIFIALAIVCDDFFVPSLEAISEKLDLSEDVAGATFMAAGSSAPELFTSIAGVTVDSDVGVGTIVGSAIFNLLVIIALTAAFSGQVLQLDWRPLLRDSVAYSLSIAFFIIFSWDGKFEMYEAAVLLILYIAYIVVMKFNPKLMDLLAEVGPKGGQVSPQGQPTEVTNLGVSDADSLVNEPAVTVLQGQHGTPAGKLPPINQESSQDEATSPTNQKRSSSIHDASHHNTRHFEHAHKGMMSRSFINLSLGRSQHHHMPRLSVSFPILRPYKSDDFDQTHRRSLAALHGHDHIRIKSIAQGAVKKELRRLSEMMHGHHIPPTPSIVQVDPTDKEQPPGDGSRPQSGVGSTDDGGYKEDEVGSTMKVCPCLPPVSIETPEYPTEERTCWSSTKYVMGWVLFVLSFPFVCLYTWTIPDCSKPHNRKWFLASFTMSIVWIAILSFGLVTVVGRSGCILNVDKFTMGLVIIAIGTSVPDALSSIIVARDGFGDMAVSNAIGSNVFDINLGLGLPFVIRILIDKMEPIRMLTPAEEIMLETGEIVISPHVKFGFLLLLFLVIALFLMAAFKFKLNKRLGLSFVFMYVLFVLYAYIQDIFCKHNC